MKILRAVAALVVFSVCFLVVLIGVTFLSREFATIWLPFTLCGVIAALLSFSQPSASRLLAWIGIACGVLVLWMVSEPQVSFQTHPRLVSIAYALAGAAAACGVCLLLRWLSSRQSAFGWALGLLLMSWLVAFFSSPSGGSGGMISAAIDFLRLSASQAELFVLILRKSIHFTFYGLLGWTAYRWALSTQASRNASFALMLALAFALFDEVRQSFYPERTGSGWDVLLDYFGAATFILVSAWRHRKSASQDHAPSS